MENRKISNDGGSLFLCSCMPQKIYKNLKNIFTNHKIMI